MTGAMYAAVSGLKSHMNKLNVIGNNIANVNTYGYKTTRMTFKESMYTTVTAGSNGGETTGGVNPSQIGYGASVGTIDLNMATATYAPTGIDMDCMIDGEGFFMVGTKDIEIEDAIDISKLNLTRVGDFSVDAQGYICDGAGQVVYGFATVQNPTYDPERAISDTNSPTILSTELVPLRLPLSAAAPDPEEEDQTWQEGEAVYPVLAPMDEATGKRSNLAADSVEFSAEPDEEGGTTSIIANDEDACIQLESISIGKDGKISGINKMTKDTVVVGYIAVASVDNPSGVTHLDGPYYSALEGAGSVRVAVLGGALEGRYLNNKGLFAEDDDELNVVTADAILNGGTTELRSGGLEASSTDIANEFSEMITTQRGYQANTRIVTVTDSMLEELVNMKR